MHEFISFNLDFPIIYDYFRNKNLSKLTKLPIINLF